jgi:hypothetical protein
MAKKDKVKELDLSNIDGLSHADAIEAVKSLSEALTAEKNAHQSTKETTDQIIEELTEENKTLSAKVNSVKVKGDNGTVKIGDKVYPIAFAKFQVGRGDLKGVYTAKDLTENAELANYLLKIGSAVLGTPVE